MLLYFHEFREFCLVAKLNLRKYCHATPFMLPTWIIHENFFHEIIEITINFLQTFSDAKISWYTVWHPPTTLISDHQDQRKIGSSDTETKCKLVTWKLCYTLLWSNLICMK